MPKKSVKVGVYQLGYRPVELWLDPQENGASFVSGMDGAKICIGYCRGDWELAVGRLLHELIELSLSDMRARFSPDIDLANGTDNFIFDFDHKIHSEMSAWVGRYIAHCFSDLDRAFAKFIKPPKRRKRR